MKIKVLTVGPIETNCYIVSCPKTKEAVVIDPGDEGERILEFIKDEQLNVKFIINTHGHHDHIGANKDIKDATKAQLLVHEKDGDMLIDPNKNLSKYMGINTVEPGADQKLQDGDTVTFGDLSFKVIHTPGHTPGGICLFSKDNKICFTGDTLFNGSVGRTDLPGGSYATLMKSIRERLVTLSNEVAIYPGHGPKSTIGDEKAINPFLK